MEQTNINEVVQKCLKVIEESGANCSDAFIIAELINEEVQSVRGKVLKEAPFATD